MKKSDLWRNNDWEFSKIKDINPQAQKAYKFNFKNIHTCAHHSETKEYSNSFSTHPTTNKKYLKNSQK